MLRLLVFFSILYIAHCSCPAGFDLVRDGKCRGKYATIQVADSAATQEAIDKCKEIDGVPAVVIHNDEDQAYWSGKIDQTRGNLMLLGLTCNYLSSKWEWTDGSAVGYKPPNYNADLDRPCYSGCAWFVSGDTWVKWCDNDKEPFDIYCEAQTRQPVPPTNGCLGFGDDSADGVCYQVVEATQNWQDAANTCRKLGGNLASIHNATENAFVRRLAITNGAVNGVFLGATISGKGADFAWVDGTKWDYTNFYPGFPMKNVGDCLAMDTSSANGEWMNVDCSAKFPVACVRDKKDITTIPEPTCNSGPFEEGALITSPGFPYNASIPCNYFLTVDEGKKVELQINFVAIYDAFLGGNQIANVTGFVHNGTYISLTNLMKVSWQPKGGVNVQGLAMTYRAF